MTDGHIDKRTDICFYRVALLLKIKTKYKTAAIVYVTFFIHIYHLLSYWNRYYIFRYITPVCTYVCLIVSFIFSYNIRSNIKYNFFSEYMTANNNPLYIIPGIPIIIRVCIPNHLSSKNWKTTMNVWKEIFHSLPLLREVITDIKEDLLEMTGVLLQTFGILVYEIKCRWQPFILFYTYKKKYKAYRSVLESRNICD